MIKFIKKFGNKFVITFYSIILLNIISSLFEIISLTSIPILFSIISDNSFEFIENQSLRSFLNNFIINLSKEKLIILTLIIIMSIFIIKGIILIINFIIEGGLKKIFQKNINYRLFEYYLNLDYLEIQKIQSSLILRNFNSELSMCFQYINAVMNMVREVMLLIIILVALIVFNFKITFFVLIILVTAFSLFYFLFQRKIKIYAFKMQSYRSKYIENISQAFGSVKETKIYKLESFFKKFFSNTVSKLNDFDFKINLVRRLPRIYLEIISVSVILGLIYYSFIIEKQNFENVIISLSFYVVCFIRIIPSLTQLNMLLTQVKQANPSYELIKKFFENKPFKKSNIEIKTKNKFLLKDKIEVCNLNFSYDTKKIIFKNANIIIRANSISGIYGSSGSGKSTLINIICGLIKIDNNIFLDSKELQKNLEEWQNSIAYIPQEIFLIDDTIYNNVALGLDEKTFDINKIKKSLKNSQLDDHIIEENKIVGEGGKLLSGGQKQRIGIARALYRDKNVLIFDEPTNHLDSNNSENFFNIIREISKDKTIIIVTHNIEHKKYFDYIYKLEKNLILSEK